MERAKVLSNVRGDKNHFNSGGGERFSEEFIRNSPANARELILQCLARNPSDRPSASDILESDLLPPQMELEDNYLQEALKIVANNQSASYR